MITTKRIPQGSKFIPIAIGIYKNDSLIEEGEVKFLITPRMKRVIEENFVYGRISGLMLDLPDSILSSLRCQFNDVLANWLDKEHVTKNVEAYSVQSQKVLPAGLLQMLPLWIRENIETHDIFEYYKVKSWSELWALKDDMPIDANPKPEVPKRMIENSNIFMKTLAIRQPWASLIALGIKDIECREAMRTKCRKIFIAASLTKVPLFQLPIEVQNLIEQLEKAGIMPAYKNWPTKCIIGHADIVKADFEPVDSIWGCDWDGMKYTFRNAEILDEPLYGLNKATPYFYNVEGYDEEHLPTSHKADLTDITLPTQLTW